MWNPLDLRIACKEKARRGLTFDVSVMVLMRIESSTLESNLNDTRGSTDKVVSAACPLVHN
jgi:hypothetical protein